ncbi:DedA family protein [Desulfovibrio litoralis]|uniref:Membrane protein DedA, SNARE-associated domain n=1 Tax=Desulfovibrio litoralis DSM 11393 TaxID=1121455 RepID=A0A1M7T6T9_9BACT|nr:DedA family protein [Desulfovibrio litoralis]SHN66414.1 membrane protein DedA, SNARE-associated domain [Desulfovibrio litoralis DSM 11393]
MTNIEEVLKALNTYGYWVILGGTFLEGETIVIIAGFLSQQYPDIFKWYWVALAAFIGSGISDQLMFSLGKFKGPWLLQRFSWINKGAEKVLPIMIKHETLLAFGFRFVYGVRNVTPICLGTGGMRYLKFLLLNITGGIVWALSFVGIGYFFGEVISQFLEENKHAGIIAASALVGLFMLIWGVRKIMAHKKKKKAPKASQ